MASDIVNFASSTGNVQDQAAYSSAAPAGFVLGSQASSSLANKALRQATVLAAGLAQFYSSASGVDIIDTNANPYTTTECVTDIARVIPTLQGTNTFTGALNLPTTIGTIMGSATNNVIAWSAANARWQASPANTALGLGSMAQQNANAVAITGGTISGVTFSGGIVNSITAGTGISTTGSTGAITIANTGVTNLSGGTGLSVSSATGATTISFASNSNGRGVRTVSTNSPTGGSDGDIWYQYT